MLLLLLRFSTLKLIILSLSLLQTPTWEVPEGVIGVIYRWESVQCWCHHEPDRVRKINRSRWVDGTGKFSIIGGTCRHQCARDCWQLPRDCCRLLLPQTEECHELFHSEPSCGGSPRWTCRSSIFLNMGSLQGKPRIHYLMLT